MHGPKKDCGPKKRPSVLKKTAGLISDQRWSYVDHMSIIRPQRTAVFSVRSFISEDRKDHKFQDRMTIFSYALFHYKHDICKNL